MLLTELHQLLPSKLFSKKLGELISDLLTKAAGDELLIGWGIFMALGALSILIAAAAGWM